MTMKIAGALVLVCLSGCVSTGDHPALIVTPLAPERTLPLSEDALEVRARAEDRLETAPQETSSTTDNRLTRARLALTRRDHKTAATIARRVLEEDFRSRPARIILAQATYMLQDHAQTAGILRILGGADAPEAAVHNLLGIQAWDKGDLADAERAFGRAIALDSADPAPRLNLAVMYLRRDEPGRAEQLCRDALKLAPESDDTRLHLGIAMARQGRFGEAEAEYKEISGWKKSPVVLYHMALLKRRSGDIEDAVAKLEAASAAGNVESFDRRSMQLVLDELRAERAAQADDGSAALDDLISRVAGEQGNQRPLAAPASESDAPAAVTPMTH